MGHDFIRGCVRPSVGPSVGPSVRRSVGDAFVSAGRDEQANDLLRVYELVLTILRNNFKKKKARLLPKRENERKFHEVFKPFILL